MARIAGVNIPTNKRVLIALQYIHGIGQKNAAEIVEKVNTLRIAVLLVNLAILIYLVVKIRQNHRERAGEASEPMGSRARP